MSNVDPPQLGGEAAQAASKYAGYVKWGMILGGLYFFGPGASIFQYGAYAIIFFLGMLFYQQDGMLYACAHPSIPKRPSQNPPTYKSPAERGMEYRTLHIKTPDGCHLHGWLMTVPKRSKNVPTVVYFHGNAGNLGLRLPMFEDFYFRLGVNVVAFDYRGYGDSTGKPNEKGLQQDATALLNYIHDDLKDLIDTKQVFLFGRSLGGAVATWLAAQKFRDSTTCGIRGLIIENTFMSIGDLALKLFGLLRAFQWLFPWLLKSKWEAKEDIKQVKVPVMLLSAQLDLLVPPAHMNTLFQNAPDDNELTRIHRFPMGGHNDTPLKEPEKYYAAFQKYFKDLGITCHPVPKPAGGGAGSKGSNDAAAAAASAVSAAARAALLSERVIAASSSSSGSKVVVDGDLKKID